MCTQAFFATCTYKIVPTLVTWQNLNVYLTFLIRHFGNTARIIFKKLYFYVVQNSTTSTSNFVKIREAALEFRDQSSGQMDGHDRPKLRSRNSKKANKDARQK